MICISYTNVIRYILSNILIKKMSLYVMVKCMEGRQKGNYMGSLGKECL